MDKKKVTRRVAMGTAIGTLAASPFVLHALRGKYEVDMPDGASAGTVGGRIVMKHEGEEITIEVPQMELRTPADEEKFKAILLEQMKKNPKVVEMDKLRFEKWKGGSRKRAMDRMDEEEKRLLEQVAKSPWEEEEKQAAAKQITELMQASRTQLLGKLAKIGDSSPQ